MFSDDCESFASILGVTGKKPKWRQNGVHPRGCPAEVVIFAWPWEACLGSDATEHGIDMCVSPWRKFSSHAIPAKFKATGQYLNSVPAVQDAVARGFREAILLDDVGQITEGSGETFSL